MNAIVENLNQWGGQFLNFAWPMLWQSSLLIALVFVVDFALARKIRASVRHALWLVVLVKLLLPPTLALPTGAAWWLCPAKPQVKPPVARGHAVTLDNTKPLPALTGEFVPLIVTEPGRRSSFHPPFAGESVPFTVPLAEPAPLKLEAAGWVLLTASATSTVLLVWLLCRWRQLARKVRAASTPEKLGDMLQHARSRAGLQSGIRLKLVDGYLSPAVCGLFRPVILLPRMLAEKLSAAQLRAVLLHEALHLRRQDLWVNCAQSLLQILYWWHPLLWVANARIRRVREEAVDDAVMLALDAEAEIYAPTLLEVARLALRRPLLSLGLVGIMESRSALRQRIERLLVFRAPRQAGLTLASACGIFVFSAVALPMGAGPAPAGRETAADVHPPQYGYGGRASPPLPLMTNARLADVLDAVALGANEPIQYAIEDYSVVFSARSSTNDIRLFQRTFRVGPAGLRLAIEKARAQTGSKTNAWDSHASIVATAKEFFSQLGVDWNSPAGKSVFYGDKLGYLFVKATESDLDTIERALQVVTQAAPQVHLTVRFYEVSKQRLELLSHGLSPQLQPPGGSNGLPGLGGILNFTNPANSTPMSILSRQHAGEVMRALPPPTAESATTGLTGQKVRLRASRGGANGNPAQLSVAMQTNLVERGPVVDVFPCVLADDYAIHLVAIPSLPESPGPELALNHDLRLNLATSADLFDGETLVLDLPEPVTDSATGLPGATLTRELLIFITPTLVDPTGRRLHPDDERPLLLRTRANPPPIPQ